MSTNKENLYELLLGFRKKINESIKENSLKEELTLSQFEALWFISLSGKQSMESIANYLRIKPPSITSMIKKMEKKGLVNRKRDIRDKRVIYINLTPKTKKHLQTLKVQKEKLLNILLSKLSQIDKKHLGRIIKKLIED